jgi:transposase
MTDQEWAIFAPFLISPSSLGGRPPKNHRKVLDGVFWISRTGAPWRDLPEVLGNWNSVHKQFRRWCQSGVWDVLLQALVHRFHGLNQLWGIPARAAALVGMMAETGEGFGHGCTTAGQ